MCTLLKDRSEDHVRAKRYLGGVFKYDQLHLDTLVQQANNLFSADMNRPLVIGGPTATSGYRLNMEAYDRSTGYNMVKGVCMQALGNIGFFGMFHKIHLAGMNERKWGEMCAWAQAHHGITGYQREHERRGAKPKIEKSGKDGDGSGPSGSGSRGRGTRGRGKRPAPQPEEQQGRRRSARLSM